MTGSDPTGRADDDALSAPETATPPRIEAIDRALLLLTALADAGPTGASLADLAETTGMNKSTAYRALATLRQRGFAHQLPEGTYRLGAAATALSERFSSPANLVRALHPALVAVAREADELVHLGTWDGDEVVYLDKVEPATRAIRVWSAVGQRVPIASSSLGRALLAGRGVPPGQLDVYTRGLPADRRVSTDLLGEKVALARRLGYATENEENEPGVACVGVALLREQDSVAAISITSLAARMTPERQAELAALLRRVLPPLLPAGVTLQAPEG